MADSLKIDRVIIREIELPLKIPFQISGGILRTRRSLVVELHSGGAVGYGESAPFEQPFYSSETIGSVWALYRDLFIARVTGKSFDSIELFEAELKRGVRGNPFARCGFEKAFWDLTAMTESKTFQELISREMERLGVAAEHRVYAPRVASGVAIGIPESGDLGELQSWIKGYLAEGYQRVKIKIRPGWDLEPCRIARETAGQDFCLWPDANASYEIEHHAETLKRLDEFEMAFIEQPLHHDDLLDHARLGKMIKTPICLDESLKSERIARQAIESGASRIWNIKVQRVGGLLEAIRIYALAAKHGVNLWGGTMPESGLGAQAILALASFPLFKYPADIEPSDRWYEPGLDPVNITMDREGWIEVPRVAGTHRWLDHARLRSCSRELTKDHVRSG